MKELIMGIRSGERTKSMKDKKYKRHQFKSCTQFLLDFPDRGRSGHQISATFSVQLLIYAVHVALQVAVV